MNLVAKEYVAAHDDEQGVLILSQFAGASRELPEALIVNPYDADECATALRDALAMSVDEQRDRMRLMRNIIREFNVYRWAGRMLLDAAAMRQRKRFRDRMLAPSCLILAMTTPLDTPRPARFVRPPPPPLGSDCALFLDIDGTLAEFADLPDAVRIDQEIAVALPRITGELDGAVALITGRAITSADRLFPGLRLPIAGQHGSERRDAAGVIHLHAPVKDTQARLRKLLRGLAKRHPQLLLEDKGATIALHYRTAPQLAALVHRTLRRSLAHGADYAGYELQAGKMLLEVRPEGRDKGTAIDDFMAEAAVRGPPAGVRRRRPHGRARLRGRRAPGRLDDQGRPRSHRRALPPSRLRRREALAAGADQLGGHPFPRHHGHGLTTTRSLDLALIGNGRIGALVDERANIVWCCFPRFDGDPVFCALLDTAPLPQARAACGRSNWSTASSRRSRTLDNTAVLVDAAHRPQRRRRSRSPIARRVSSITDGCTSR